MTEAKVLRERGARAHPGSGSGKIQFDGSTDDEVIEVKEAAKSFTLSLLYLRRLFDNATRQGKGARMVVRFPGYEADITITRRFE